MATNEWKKRCETEWNIKGISMPDGVDWKFVYEAKPFGRNLLRNPAPHGVSQDSSPPERELTEFPPEGPPRSEPEGDYTGWTTSREDLGYDASGVPPGVTICYLPNYSWFTLEQRVDLKAEGVWDELLDSFQPDIVIKDWYEESQLHESIYQLQVRLLGTDGQTVISEYVMSPTEELSEYSHNWKEVSHVFSDYGPGVRYVHFLHRLKNKFMVEFFPTLVTGSTVLVKPSKSSR
ncbi:F-box only protein 50 [Oncorhynchus kisutch]|uniref:P1, F-box associated domain containing n=1 Tax=Oncorhynchus kisutch TaxID=8019 RepID=A0A8C7KVM2_ONCKI|nr:F-box only protein 50 [Oncorhynchus kisutch]